MSTSTGLLLSLLVWWGSRLLILGTSVAARKDSAVWVLSEFGFRWKVFFGLCVTRGRREEGT